MTRVDLDTELANQIAALHQRVVTLEEIGMRQSEMNHRLIHCSELDLQTHQSLETEFDELTQRVIIVEARNKKLSEAGSLLSEGGLILAGRLREDGQGIDGLKCEVHELHQLLNLTITRLQAAEKAIVDHHIDYHPDVTDPGEKEDWGDIFDQDRCKDCGEDLRDCMCGEPQDGEFWFMPEENQVEPLEPDEVV